MKLCIVSDDLSTPFDEGIKNFAYSLTRELSSHNTVLALYTRGGEPDEEHVQRLKANRIFLNPSFCRKIGAFAPDIVLYIPSSSATLPSFVRSRVLKRCSKDSDIVMVALQPRAYSFLARRLIPFLKPELVLVQSQAFLRRVSDLGCRVELIPGGVDIERFRPANDKRKVELREKYGLGSDKFVVLHVGHVNRNRGVGILKEIQGERNQTLLVGSVLSVSRNRALVHELSRAGVRVVTRYIKNVEEIYQLSDCYLFPVRSESASIQVPLSVLEAMACNLPVVSTRYGGLQWMFKEGGGFFYCDSVSDVANRIEEARNAGCIKTRALVEPFSWKAVADDIVYKAGNCEGDE